MRIKSNFSFVLLWQIFCLFGVVCSSNHNWIQNSFIHPIPSSPILSSACYRKQNTQTRKNQEISLNNFQQDENILKKILNLSGGSTNSDLLNQESNNISNDDKEISVLVSSSIGSDFLDKKKKLILPGNATIHDLKIQLQQKFPGSPPLSLQRLFFGIKKLSNEQMIRNLTTISPIPILLDMICGTSVYEKTLSVGQTIEAYVASIVQQTYISDKIKYLYSSDEEKELYESRIQFPETSTIYREMFHDINATVYSNYVDDINLALAEEREPEIIAADTSAWRKRDEPNKNSILTQALAKEFDLNWRGLKNFIYYSLLMGMFAYFGTNGELSSQVMLALIPFLWISKLRQLRLLYKIVLYLTLPIISKLDFIMPLLSAPMQVIALESAKFPNGAAPRYRRKIISTDNDGDDEDINELEEDIEGDDDYYEEDVNTESDEDDSLEEEDYDEDDEIE